MQDADVSVVRFFKVKNNSKRGLVLNFLRLTLGWISRRDEAIWAWPLYSSYPRGLRQYSTPFWSYFSL